MVKDSVLRGDAQDLKGHRCCLARDRRDLVWGKIYYIYTYIVVNGDSDLQDKSQLKRSSCHVILYDQPYDSLRPHTLYESVNQLINRMTSRILHR